MNQGIVNNYVRQKEQMKGCSMYQKCVESKEYLLGGILEKYNLPATKLLFGGTKDEVVSGLKAYADYEIITAGYFRDYVNMIYKHAREFLSELNIASVITKPDQLTNKFLLKEKEQIKQWRINELMPSIADMTTEKEEYENWMKTGYAECVSIALRTISLLLSLLLENYEEYLYDQMDEKETEDDDRVFFLMSTFSSYVTEKISFLSEVCLVPDKYIH